MALMERRTSLLTNDIFFDTDCICAFLWVNNQSLLERMYSGQIVVPKAVYDEINRPTITHLKERLDNLIHKGVVIIKNIEITSPEYELYRQLTTFSGNNKVIGSGEAAAISLTKSHNGILGSNNLADITEYVTEFSLKHMTTGDIMAEALERGFISEEEGNNIWARMLRKKRRLGAASFTEFLQNKR